MNPSDIATSQARLVIAKTNIKSSQRLLLIGGLLLVLGVAAPYIARIIYPEPNADILPTIAIGLPALVVGGIVFFFGFITRIGDSLTKNSTQKALTQLTGEQFPVSKSDKAAKWILWILILGSIGFVIWWFLSSGRAQY